LFPSKKRCECQSLQINLRNILSGNRRKGLAGFRIVIGDAAATALARPTLTTTTSTTCLVLGGRKRRIQRRRRLRHNQRDAKENGQQAFHEAESRRSQRRCQIRGQDRDWTYIVMARPISRNGLIRKIYGRFASAYQLLPAFLSELFANSQWLTAGILFPPSNLRRI